MTEITSAYDYQGRTIVDAEGEKIGEVREVYQDHEGGHAEWALVTSGLFGTKHAFVPLRGAQPAGEDVRVPVSKAQVNDAPGVEADGELSEQEEQQLFEHYGVPYTTEGSTAATGAPAGGETAAGGPAGTVGRDASGPTTDEAMTRSEEELRVGVQRQERGRVRLRKRVVTEHVQTTVPVQHEEIHVEREPITEANVDQALDGPAISEEEHEVVLHEERPVVGKETVPKERVRLAKDTVTEEQTVGDEIRKEQIEADDSDLRR